MIIPITNELLVAGDKEIAILEEKASKLLDIVVENIINGEGIYEPTGLVSIDKASKPDFTANIKLMRSKDGLVTNIHICDERYEYPEFLTKRMHTPGSK